MEPRSTAELDAWYADYRPETAIDAGFPIVDPHHHLAGTAADRNYYRREEIVRDLSSGHRVLATVYCEGHQPGFLTEGPLHLRSAGEVQRIVALTPAPLNLPQGACQVAAGIISKIDLTLPESQLTEALEAHRIAGRGRLRGVRQLAAYDPGPLGDLTRAPAGILADPRLRRGLARLQSTGLSLDVLAFHPQIDEVAELADAFPDAIIVLNHAGMLLGVDAYSGRRPEEFGRWREAIVQLAKRPNVRLKLGGLGVPFFGFGFEHGGKPAASDALAAAWRPVVETSVAAFGASRSMFESNYPVDRQSAGYTEIWNAFQRLTASASIDQRKDLFYRTACRTYGLPDVESRCDAELAGTIPTPRSAPTTVDHR